MSQKPKGHWRPINDITSLEHYQFDLNSGSRTFLILFGTLFVWFVPKQFMFLLKHFLFDMEPFLLMIPCQDKDQEQDFVQGIFCTKWWLASILKTLNDAQTKKSVLFLTVWNFLIAGTKSLRPKVFCTDTIKVQAHYRTNKK